MVIGSRNVRAIAGTIANRRKSLGMTQSQLSERSGISQGMISMIESGTKRPAIGMLVSILEALELVLKIEENKKS